MKAFCVTSGGVGEPLGCLREIIMTHTVADPSELSGSDDNNVSTTLSPHPSDGAPEVVPAADLQAYLEDMILELQQMASRSGQHNVAFQLLEAHKLVLTNRRSGAHCAGGAVAQSGKLAG